MDYDKYAPFQGIPMLESCFISIISLSVLSPIFIHLFVFQVREMFLPISGNVFINLNVLVWGLIWSIHSRSGMLLWSIHSRSGMLFFGLVFRNRFVVSWLNF
jgi:hypothetical protein